MLHCKHQADTLVCLHLLTAYVLQVLHYKVGTALFDLIARVARAHSDDYGTGRNASLNTTRRIFKDDTSRGLVAEALGGEEERVRRRLARAESWVVRRDGHFGRDDTGPDEATMRCSNNIPPVSPVATETASERGGVGWLEDESAPYVFAPDVATA